MNAIVPIASEETMFMPVMAMKAAVERRNYVVEFTRTIMVEGTDFGKIPGAGDKPTLLKPGAEKLATFFGLTPIFIPVAVVEDWTGDEHKGEPFFYYRYRCELHRNGVLVASSEGSCNTWESKYRYRQGERKCPNCGKSTIIKGKEQYGGGWICFAKKGGCGAKFNAGDKSIEGQDVGRVANPDVADQVNTVQKMAQKRALIAATLLAVNASEFFTQDIEDMVIEGDWQPVVETVQEKPKQGKSAPADVDFGMGDNPVDGAPQASVKLLSKAQLIQLHELGEKVYAEKWDAVRPHLVKLVSGASVSSSKELTPNEADHIIAYLQLELAGRQFYSDEWNEQRQKLTDSISNGKVQETLELSISQLTRLTNGIHKKAAEVAAITGKAQPIAAGA